MKHLWIDNDMQIQNVTFHSKFDMKPAAANKIGCILYRNNVEILCLYYWQMNKSNNRWNGL